MASAVNSVSNQVFVSPGVYTSEVDLSFVSQSVGVTTLGIVGETLQGPAFQPIFLTNYTDFQTYFGGTQPSKFVNTQIPKYESAYIAKAYLQQSNQLFVTRILGLSGYDAGPSWTITTIANVSGDSIALNGTVLNISVAFSATTGGTVAITGTFPGPLNSILNNTYTSFDGSSKTIVGDVTQQITQLISNPGLSGTSVYFYGSIPDADFNSLSGKTAQTNVFGVDNPDIADADLSSALNDAWFYATFVNLGNGNYTGFSFSNYFSGVTETAGGNFTGTIVGKLYEFSGKSYSNYDDLVVATIRSRGISTYTIDNGPTYEVSGLTNLIIDTSNSYSGITSNPYSHFGISGITATNNTMFDFEVSLNLTDAKYIKKVLGFGNFDKDMSQVPIFVEETFDVLLSWGYNQGYIRGLNTTFVDLPSARSGQLDSIGWYLDQYQTPVTPNVVSELRGNKIYNLFYFTSISDGNSANSQIKISIINISFDNLSFDVLVRYFYDTDQSPIVYEKYSNCNLDPTSNNYIARQIGTVNGDYNVNSKYIMVTMDDNVPTDAVPCGFEGYTFREYANATPPFPIYKTQYYLAGQTIFNPPFQTDIPTTVGDKVRRAYLGFSTDIGVDVDFLQYKGSEPGISTCDSSDGPWSFMTKGFHMDSGATVAIIANGFTSSGTAAFDVGIASFNTEPTDPTSPYFYLYSRKYTVMFYGGFDGWDIYREYRSNGDTFQLGSAGFNKGACFSSRFPNATGAGMFKPITINQDAVDWANTDFYAYLYGIQTFQNPEAVNINVLVTPGIDYVNNAALVGDTIDMVENNRADSIYITTTPDWDMFVPSATDSDDQILPLEAIGNLDDSGYDSNYTATYYPWVLTLDTVTNTQLWIPATAEVTRNLALTDNIAYPWFATAGYTRGLVNSIKARKKLTQEDRDTLYGDRINPIATFSDVGTVIWGNKTLQIADSALNRLNVRRLLLQARKLISAVAVRLLFEQNDQIVRNQFLNLVNPILDSIRRDRGLYDFRVTVSSSTQDLNNNQLTGSIYIQPTSSLEFIDITFYITPAGASFENI